MDVHVVITCLLVIVARIADVSIGTIRTVFVVHGRKGIVFVLGFVEVLIWFIVVTNIIRNLHHPIYGVCYALGFAAGTYIGITVEGWFGLGEQIVRIFTKQGTGLANELRSMGYVVTEFDGKGQKGPVCMLFLKTDRRKVRNVVEFITRSDPDVFYIIDDVRLSSGKKVRYHNPTGWRAIPKKK